MTIGVAGYGAGDHEFPEHANVLRVTIGESLQVHESQTVAVLEANIDDMTGEAAGYAMERLLAGGALDVSMTPMYMKKNRPGIMLTVLARPEDRDRLAQMMFAETSTFGLRMYSAERRVRAREMHEVETQYGSVRVKVADTGTFAPEYEDCRRIAQEHGVPLLRVMAEAEAAYMRSKQ